MFIKKQTHESFLFQVLHILDVNNIEYCLWAGTLLGAVREQRFLPSDTKDTDIALDEKYYWKVRKLFDKEVLKNKLKWHYVWRKELSVVSLDNKTKMDMFFLEKNNGRYYWYAYTKNSKNGKWNHEWRNICTASYIFPTNIIKFYNKDVRIPNNYNMVLTESYGTWEVPDPNWKCIPESYLNLDKKYEGFYPAGLHSKDYNIDTKSYNVAYVCTTIRRNNCMKKTIKSIQTWCPNIKIYVADQNTPNATMLKFYEDHNVEYYFTEFNSGLAWNRNFLVSKVQEPYVFIGDDDITFTEETNIKTMEDILTENEEIGIVGGSLKNTPRYDKRLIWDNKNKKVYMIQVEEVKNKTKKGNIFTLVDLVLNFFLAKTEVLKECKWDNDLKLCEHLEYFLRFKETKWKVAFTPEVIAIHDRGRPGDYAKFRGQSKKYLKIMMKKYGIDSLKDIISLENTPLHIQNINIPEIQSDKNKIKPIAAKVGICKTPAKETKKIEYKPISKKARMKNISTNIKIIGDLVSNGYQVCLMGDTCYRAITKKDLCTEKLFLGVSDLIKTKELINSDNVVLYNLPKNSKGAKIFDLNVTVPFPVIKYLELNGYPNILEELR